MSGLDLRGKRCVITGAASGIGRATANAAAAQGAELFLTDRNGDGLEQVTAEIRDAGGLSPTLPPSTWSTMMRWLPSPRKCMRSRRVWTWS